MQHVSAKCTPSIINATQVQPGQILRQQLGQRGFGHRPQTGGGRPPTCWWQKMFQ